MLLGSPDEDVKTEPSFGDREQQDGFHDEGGRSRCGSAGYAETRNQRDAQANIDAERGGVDQGADPLLAQHVEQALDRAYGGPREQSDGQDEHHRVAFGELWTEEA